MVDSITDEDITKINAYQRTIAAAAATDKMRLLCCQETPTVSILFNIISEAAGGKVIDISSPDMQAL
jgi:hypothetical protein